MCDVLGRHWQARVQGCVRTAVAHDSGEQVPVLYQDFVEDAGNARGCEQKAARRLSSTAAPVKGTLGRSILRRPPLPSAVNVVRRPTSTRQYCSLIKASST